MKIKKGTLVQVNHSRSGNWKALATKDFDTKKDEWYPLQLVDEEVNGMSTSWIKGDEMPARRGHCTIEIVSDIKKGASESKMIDISQFGKDHWSLLAYCEYRAVNDKGRLDLKHLRCKNLNVATTSLGQNFWKPEYGTRLKGYFSNPIKYKGKKVKVTNSRYLLKNHDDFDCLNDLDHAGLIENLGTMLNPFVKLTEKGQRVAALLSVHKQNGGHFTDFVFE
jgi:hypothetical protein